MKKLIWILLLILVAASVFLLWHKPTQRLNHGVVAPTQSNSTSLDPQMSAAPKSNSLIQTAPSFQPKPGEAIGDSNQTEVFKQMVEDKNSPIEFYGRVINQDGNGLPGMLVKATIRQWYVRSLAAFDFGAHFIPIERKTKTDGSFEIRGERGDGFGVVIEPQNGYEQEPSQRSFGAVSGSFQNPVIFKMWSTNIHEQLITGEKKFPIVPDGRIYILNLAQGTIAESGDGDLKVWIQYTNQVTRGQLYDWSAGVEVINGGLCPSEVYAMFLAPDDGYVPTFRLEQQIKGGQSGEIGERRFYLKMKNGQTFGKMTINLFAPYNNQNPGLIRLSYAINPSGSRILR